MEEVSLFKNPIICLSVMLQIIFEKARDVIVYIITHKILLLFIIGYCILNLIETPLTDKVLHVNMIGKHLLYWLVLGIASSIGLGTGLHTFVLYLGPHIAKVTMAANECSYFPEMNPSRWNFVDFLPCTDTTSEKTGNSIFTILAMVQLEAFMWGVGTAIGELPPYFMARAAAIAGKSSEEVDEVENIKNPTTFIEKAKVFIYQHLKKHGFLTVLLCASVR